MATLPNRWSQPVNGAAFKTTLWPVVERAGRGDGEAISALYGLYTGPLYSHLRRKGRGPEDAQDMVQTLFVNLVEKNGFAQVSANEGRLRTWLMRCADNLLKDEIKRQGAEKRGAGQRPISWDGLGAEERYRLEPAPPHTPQEHYDRNWAQATLDYALDQLRKEVAGDGAERRFDALVELLIPDSTETRYAEVARRLRIPEATVKSTVCKLRKRLRTILRDAVSLTVQSPEEVEQEIRYLVKALRS